LSRYAVIYDACILYPAPLRDLLVQLATANLFRAQWTDQIHEEWISNLSANRPDIPRSALERTKDLMNKAVMDPLVTGYEKLVSTFVLPDPDDRHVLAAAVHARADAIVTFNIADFPDDILRSQNLEAIHPDDFITYQFDLNEAAVISAANAVCRRLRNPQKTGREYLDILLKQRLPKTVAMLRPYETLISTIPQSEEGEAVRKISRQEP
jgi:predicted nucleic acid-binding protein